MDVVILNQLQPLHAGMPVLADDEVIVHGDAMSMIAFVARHSRNSFREFGEHRGETTEVFR